MREEKKIAIIVGAGPAGLTAAFELLKDTNVKPIVFEASEHIGGISKTINYKGNYIDIGGHRFFSKSEKVMKWWQEILPVNENENGLKDVMLIRNRISRILYNKQLFNYPITLSLDTIKKLGIINIFLIGLSYFRSAIFQIKPEKNLEQFFINRFGRKLYKTFFKDYTEKVWGVSCKEISAEWGAQRVKGLSVFKTITNAVGKLFKTDKSINQKSKETTLIEKFLYPKFGPGQLWQKVAKIVVEKGGDVILNSKIVKVNFHNNNIKSVIVSENNILTEYNCDYLISSMPIRDLINSFTTVVPNEIKDISNGLVYRDFITVGILASKVVFKEKNKKLISDNWIYVQESHVKLGRIQIFNNWSPYMVNDNDKVWVGLEYFCNENDELWSMSDNDMSNFAIKEIEQIGFMQKSDILDSVVIREPKAYPAYFGTYDKLYKVIDYLNNFENLFLIGRNGMHRYNNQDHSMLTAFETVKCIKIGSTDKAFIWEVNTEKEYHEERK